MFCGRIPGQPWRDGLKDKGLWVRSYEEENQYQMLYGQWPTWRQCRMLADRYGKR